MAFFSEIRKQHTHVMCGKNAVFLTVKPGSRCNNH